VEKPYADGTVKEMGRMLGVGVQVDADTDADDDGDGGARFGTRYSGRVMCGG
jgi:hypothetical protein